MLDRSLIGKRVTGVVKFFNQQKGYGFLIPDNGGADIFFHITAVESDREPETEDKLVGIVASDRKGLALSRVQIIETSVLISVTEKGRKHYTEEGTIQSVHSGGFGWAVTDSGIKVWIPPEIVGSVSLAEFDRVCLVYRYPVQATKMPRTQSIRLLNE